MQSLIRVSAASIIAVHSMDYKLKNKKPAYSARELAGKMKVSYNHLSKVLQRLAAGNLVAAYRGPSGGYLLTEKGKRARLGEIINAIEGESERPPCFMSTKTCGRSRCVLKNFLDKTSREFNKLLNLKLGDF